jgi:transcriptional regulator with XRE-family HTH domain
MKKGRRVKAVSRTQKPESLKNFGDRLRQLRKQAGYSSQLGFAYENGFNPPQYNKWERGEDIKLSNITRLCQALNISLASFFEPFDQL